MNYYCNPLNLEYKYQFVRHMDQNNEVKNKTKITAYREAADPSLVLFKDLYYLFPSMTAGYFTSEDLVEWNFQKYLSDMPIYDYAPDVRVVGDYLYFSASRKNEACSFYRTKDPLNEPFEEIEGTFPFWDPNLFEDEDGKVYFYWGCSNITPIYGVELDPETMKPLTEPLVMFDSNKKEIGYERSGEDHISPKKKDDIEKNVNEMIEKMMEAPEDIRRSYGFFTEEDIKKTAYSVYGDDPYIEGAWMTKYNNLYYLQYAIPGTEYNIYGDGVYVSQSPLGPFTLAKNNPYSYKPGGFMNGAGHGSTLQDKKGDFWHTSTMAITCSDNMERRLGLWKAGFDKDGELYCDQRYGDWPIDITKPAFTEPEWMILSYGKKVKASSGKGMENVTDENCRTWWRASSSRSGEWVEVDLEREEKIHAIQINFADDLTVDDFPENGYIFKTYYERHIDEKKEETRWILEGSTDGEDYFVIQDNSKAKTDYAHDFLVWKEGIKARYLRLTIISLPYNQVPCVSGIRAFGLAKGDLPEKTGNVQGKKEGDLDMIVSWEEDKAVGYNILWGHAPDKLYHSYMVYGKKSQHIGALVKGQEVYIRVDSFNEVGITQGDIIKVE